MWVTIASVGGGVISLMVIAVMGMRTHRKLEKSLRDMRVGLAPD
jgi:hypothetical protein